MKRRVLFIKKRYSPFGGAEIYLSRIISQLENNFDIHILSERWPLSPKINIHLLRKSRIFPDLFFALNALHFLKKRGNYFDLVISFDRCLKQDVYRSSDGCHLRWLEQRRFFETKTKHWVTRFNPKHRAIAWLEKKCLTNSKKVLVNSKMVLKDYIDFYGKDISSKIEICYNGIDLEKFFPISEEEKLENKKKLRFNGKHVLLFIGSGYKRKGLDYLLKGLSLLNNNFILLVIGKEKNLENFKKISRQENLDKKVYFLGPQKNILPYYQSADIFVLPTLYDPFANVTLEALACGLPVITSIFNGASEIITKGKEGFTLKDPKYFPIDIKKFTKELIPNLENLRKNCREKAEEFSLSLRIKDFLRATELC